MSENHRFHILLIEDEADVRESYLDMLDFFGYQVTPAANGKEGLELLTSQEFDVVITDLNMPVMNGMELLKRMRELQISTEVIVITGFATIENAISAMKQGAFDYITKPVSVDHVRIVLNKCIQKIASGRENKILRDANEELKELNDLKNKFITITNHEMRTPIAVLKGYLDLMAMVLEGSDNQELNEFMHIVQITMDELNVIVDNMHELSRTRLISSQSEALPFEMNELLRELEREMKLLFDQRNIRLRLVLPDKELTVSGHRLLIKRAIRELMQNALKFTREGGSTEVLLKEISLRKEWLVMVRDTGIGIPLEKIEFIFDPFYEVQDSMHHSTSRTEFMGGGIGVGLSLVKEIAKAHNWELAVESHPGVGSTFTMIIPVPDLL